MMAGAMPLASTVIILLILVEAKTSYKLHADGFHQYRVHLVIDKVIHFQYASRIAFSVF